MTKTNPGTWEQDDAALAIEPEQLATQWACVRGRIQQEVGEVAYRNWLRDMTLARLDADELTIVLPTPMKRDWVRQNYADRLLLLWQAEHPGVRRIEFLAARSELPQAQPAAAAVPAATHATPIAADERELGAPLDSRYEFANFVVGKPNEFAHACARRVAERPNSPGFNPLFLYGGVGLGKTHLMHAIGLELRREKQSAKVVYMSGEKFMYRFIAALRNKSIYDFKEQLRSADVLMVDDLQFLAGKDNTQEEFFHTFNAIVDSGKQIVVSADQAPTELDGIEDRLRTRLGCGVVADLHATTFELRMSILATKAKGFGLDVPGKVLEFLAHKVATNVRELEGCLHRLSAHVAMFHRPITLEFVQDALRDILKAHDRRVTIEEIQKRVATHFGIRLTDMTSARKSINVARPRQVAMYLSKTITERSLPEIGRMFGKRDHTTVMHAIKRVQTLMESDPDFREQVELLEGLLKRS